MRRFLQKIDPANAHLQRVYFIAIIVAGMLVALWTWQANTRLDHTIKRGEKNTAKIALIQRQSCHDNNVLKINQKTVLGFLLDLIHQINKRTVIGLPPVSAKIEQQIQDAYDNVPRPDFDCDGLPG